MLCFFAFAGRNGQIINLLLGIFGKERKMENFRNQNEIGEKEVLVVSFGTTFAETRQKTIGAIEEAVEKAFPDWSVRRAFTSGMIRSRLANRDGIEIDGPEEALERAVRNGVKELTVQPTHLMDGREYNKLMEILARYVPRFEKVSVGLPLLSSPEDFTAVAAAIRSHLPVEEENTAVVLMGHGTDVPSNAVYAEMQSVLNEGDEDEQEYFIGTVEGTPTVTDILTEIWNSAMYLDIVLAPFMIVAGDHATNDLAGDEEESWKTIFINHGYRVTTQLQGIGEWQEIQELFARHALEAAPL